MKNFFRFDIVVNFIKDKNLIDTEFCKLCGIELSELNKMQVGDNTFMFESLCKIAKAMDIDLMNFFMPYSIPRKYE